MLCVRVCVCVMYKRLIKKRLGMKSFFPTRQTEKRCHQKMLWDISHAIILLDFLSVLGDASKKSILTSQLPMELMSVGYFREAQTF